jgi:hypothetical protein
MSLSGRSALSGSDKYYNGVKAARYRLRALQQTHGKRYVQRVIGGIQAKATSGYLSEVTPNFESRIQSIRCGGHPLPACAFYEVRFGYGFSHARRHCI